MSAAHLTCAELVELVTDYLEGALDPGTADRFLAHVSSCPGCETYLDQFRATIRVVGRIEPESADRAMLDPLMDAFRDWKTR